MHNKIGYIATFIIILCFVPFKIQAREYTREHPLVIEGNWSYPPLEFLDKNGDPQGFNMDMLRILMKRLNIPYVIKLKDLSDMLEDIHSGKADLACAQYAKQREKYFHFGKVTYASLKNRMMHNKNTKPIFSMGEMFNRKIYVRKYGVCYYILSDLKYQKNLRPVTKIDDAMRRINEGSNDVVVHSQLPVNQYIAENGFDNLESLDIGIPDTQYRFIGNDTTLLNKVDSVFLVVNRQGLIDPLYNEWFQSRAEKPGTPMYIYYILGGLCVAILLLYFFISFLRYKIRKANEQILEKNKRLEIAVVKASQADKLKSKFLANMSHEIRTPLNAIVGFSNLLINGNDNSEEDKNVFAKMINTNTELLLRLINDILDLSRMDSDSMKIEYKKTDFSKSFDATFTTLKQHYNNPDVDLICSNPFPSLMVNVDYNRIAQIITNFFTNAVKYTKQGYIRVGYDYEDDGIKIYCEDTGKGIPEDQCPLVFDRFVKLNEFVQGTGLGLSICKAITDLMNGKIGVLSELGAGSTFWAWIPAERIED